MIRVLSRVGVGVAAAWLLCAGAATAAELRVATLLPAAEVALRGLPGVQVVAGIRASMRAPERSDVIDLGTPHAPNLERLASARADLIVADALINAPIRAELGRTGGEVMLLDTTSVDSTFAALETLGKRAGAEAQMAERVKTARARLASQALAQPLKVLALFGTPGSFQVVTGGAWIGSLLEALHYQNLGAQLTGAGRFPGFAEVSDEVLATLRPDWCCWSRTATPTRIRRRSTRRSRAPVRGAGSARRRAACTCCRRISSSRIPASPCRSPPRRSRPRRAAVGAGRVQMISVWRTLGLRLRRTARAARLLR